MATPNEYHIGGFRILPPVVKNLLIINGLFYLATLAFGRYVDLNDLLGLHFVVAEKFHLYQFFSYMFMHATFSHIFFNMFALWMFGSAIENYWGARRFLAYYLITGIGAGIVQEISWAIELRDVLVPGIEMINTGSGGIIPKADFLNQFVTVGASGAVYGLLLAFGMLFPNSMIYIYFFIPMKAKWFVVIYGAIELLNGIFASSDGIAHFAHLGGMIFGFFLIKYWQHKDKQKQKNNYYHYQ